MTEVKEERPATSQPLHQPQVGIIRALVTQSDFSSPTWKETWRGHHYPFRRTLILMLLSFVVSFISTVSLCIVFWKGSDVNFNMDKLLDLSKACLTDLCETVNDVEIECVAGVSDSRDKDYVIDWKGDVSKSRQIPDTCLDIAAVLYDNILSTFMEEDDMEATEKLFLWMRSSNISLVDFKFMNRQLRLPTSNSSEKKLESAMFTFSSDCKLYSHAIDGEILDLDSFRKKDSDDRVMIRLAENMYCSNGESQATSLILAHKWIQRNLFLVLFFCAFMCSWIISLGMLVTAIGNCFISAVLLYWIIPPTKELVGWRSTTFGTIYWSLLLLTITIMIDTPLYALFAVLSMFVYKDQKATMEWIFLIFVDSTATIWEPSLVSIAQEQLPLFDGLGIIRFIGGNILPFFSCSRFGGTTFFKLIWFYAFVQSYPGQFPRFLTQR